MDSDLGPSLREICAANRSDEKQVLFNVVKWYSPFSWFLLVLYWFYGAVTSYYFYMNRKLKQFLKMSDLQCVQTTLIGLETVVLMLSLETLINHLSLTFWKHILQTMQLRNCRLVVSICSIPRISLFTIAVDNRHTYMADVL